MFWLLLLLCYQIALSNEANIACRPLSSKGTPKHIKEIFIGRCWDYQTYIQANSKPRKCNNLWVEFRKAFANKPKCTGSLDDYMNLIDKVGIQAAANRSLFWSGTCSLVHEFTQARKRLTGLHDTILGYALDGLIWCGTTTSDQSGIDHLECPNSCDGNSTSSHVNSFWQAMSVKFAKQAAGVVNVVLNGSQDVGRAAYYKGSIFSKFELPNFDATKVSKIRALVVHSIDKEMTERCGEKSLVELEKDIVEKYKMPFECVDSPKRIRHLLCIDDPSAEMCRFAEAMSGDNNGMGKVMQPGCLLIAIVILSFFM